MFAPLQHRRVMVTGAAGYLGSHLVAGLAHAGVETLALDLRPGPPAARVRVVDLGDRDATLASVAGFEPDVVFHCATASAMRYASDYRTCFRADLLALDNLLEGLSPTCRVVQLSSSYVASGADPGTPLDEAVPLKPTHAFGEAKLFFEAYLKRVHPASVSFRLCSVFGSGTGVFPNAVTQMASEARRTGQVTVWGAGARRMQYVHLDDVLRCLGRALDVAPGVYHLGGDAYVTVAETARALAAHLDARVVFDAARTEGETLPFLSNARLKRALGTDDAFAPFDATLAAYARQAPPPDEVLP